MFGLVFTWELKQHIENNWKDLIINDNNLDINLNQNESWHLLTPHGNSDPDRKKIPILWAKLCPILQCITSCLLPVVASFHLKVNYQMTCTIVYWKVSLQLMTTVTYMMVDKVKQHGSLHLCEVSDLSFYSVDAGIVFSLCTGSEAD